MIKIDDFKDKDKLQFPIVIRPFDYNQNGKKEYVIWDYDVIGHTSSFYNNALVQSKYLDFYKGTFAFKVPCNSEIVDIPFKESKLIHFGKDYVTDNIEGVRKQWTVKFKKNDNEYIETKEIVNDNTVTNSNCMDYMTVREIMSVEKAIEEYGYLPDDDIWEVELETLDNCVPDLDYGMYETYDAIMCFTTIPPNFLNLIYKGTGESY
jgi:hypothetical protein